LNGVLTQCPPLVDSLPQCNSPTESAGFDLLRWRLVSPLKKMEIVTVENDFPNLVGVLEFPDDVLTAKNNVFLPLSGLSPFPYHVSTYYLTSSTPIGCGNHGEIKFRDVGPL